MEDRPRVGVSSCLLGEEVRFNGGHKRYRFLTDDRPLWSRLESPRGISDTVITRLHVALRERSLRNKL